MTYRAKSRQISRQFLLGAVVTTLPLFGCALIVPPEERAGFEHASTTGDVAAVNDFLRQYPDSPLAGQLLSGLPPATLKRLSKKAVRGVSPDILASLPPDVRALLGLTVMAKPTDVPTRKVHSGYDG